MKKTTKPSSAARPTGLSVFEKYLTLWVVLCIGGGIALGRVAPSGAVQLDAIAVYQV